MFHVRFKRNSVGRIRITEMVLREVGSSEPETNLLDAFDQSARQDLHFPPDDSAELGVHVKRAAMADQPIRTWALTVRGVRLFGRFEVGAVNWYATHVTRFPVGAGRGPSSS